MSLFRFRGASALALSIFVFASFASADSIPTVTVPPGILQSTVDSDRAGQGAKPGAPSITIGPGTSPAGSYLSLSTFSIAPLVVSDDSVSTFNVPTFRWAGSDWDRIGFSSNGYILVAPTGAVEENSIVNQNFPNATAPNHVLAPYWTDLNPASAGEMRIGSLTDGVHTWIVCDWKAVREFSTAGNLHSFEVWIGIGGVEDITFAYGPNTGTGDGGLLSVGAEDQSGTVGAMRYFNGTGALLVNGDQMRVSSDGLPEPTCIALLPIAAMFVRRRRSR